MRELYGLKGFRYLLVSFALLLCAVASFFASVVLLLLVVKQTISWTPWFHIPLTMTYVASAFSWVLLVNISLGAVQRINYAVALFVQRYMIPVVIISVLACCITHILFTHWISGRKYDLLTTFVPLLIGAFLIFLTSVIVCANVIYLIKFKTRAIGKMQKVLDQLSGKSEPVELERLQRWIDLEAGRLPANPGVLMRPPCFLGLTSKAWHRPEDFAWVKTLENSFEIIKKEALSIYADHKKKIDGHQLKQYQYIGVSKKTWLSFYIYQGDFVKENCKRCPQTETILRSLPISFPSEVIFSILDPRSKISPHRDTGNLTLTCHLGLSVPPGSAIRVGGEERTWQEGKCLILDASYEHEAWNDSDQPRIVLLFDFFHPELTPLEREYICTMRGIPTHALSA
jgi:hypothetical protein